MTNDIMGQLVYILILLLQIYSYVLLARIILSWVRVSPYHPTWGPIVNVIYQLTEPVMEPARRLLPPAGGLDFSPILIFLGINLLIRLLAGLA
ncbi:MAG: YggT family protein [Anaerolineales bacterium]|nr:YggT family protein [Anaerolineales bacterium]